jgi:ZIP family zinc transporter
MIVSAVLYALIPAAVLLVVGGIATVRRPSAQWTSYFQHFAGGVVLSALATDVIPDVMRRHEIVATGVGFGIGILVMLGIREVAEKYGGGHGHGGAGEEPHEEAHDHEKEAEEGAVEGKRSNLGLVLSVGVDLLVDGFLIGLGFAAGGHMGALLTLALTIEVAFLALSTAAKATRRQVLTRMAMFGAFMVAGAAAGAGIGGALPDVAMAGALAFGCAALLYLVAEELLVEAHEAKETPISGAMLGLGFLVIMLLDMITW